MIRAVVFDLDDTLYPESQFVLSGFQAVGEWLTEEKGVSGFCQVATDFFKAGSRGNIFDLALERLGVDPENGIVGQLVGIYRTHRPDLKLFADAAWAIEFFREKKKLAIITDGWLQTQRNKIRALQLKQVMDVIVCSDEFGREAWKPSDVPYRRVMESLDVVGESCVYVADNPAKDFVTARKLGWRSIQICREDGEYAHLQPEPGYEADVRIESLYELRDHIA